MRPFTYYLYHKPTGLKYYGVRYSKRCDPKDLWTTYFTSSPIVKQMIKEYGVDSFSFKLRKTFNTSEEALLWENRVLTRLNAASNPQWINRNNGGRLFKGPVTHSATARSKMSKKNKGIPKTEEHRKKISESSLKDREKRRQEGWKMPEGFAERMLKTRKQKIEAGEINPYSAERNAKMSASKKGTRRHYLPDGSFIMVKD